MAICGDHCDHGDRCYFYSLVFSPEDLIDRCKTRNKYFLFLMKFLDPEIPVISIVELGVIRDVVIAD